jgi:catechol 2,3-dioxygenase-like lactoylglutathione lyase family enzyme
MFEINGIAHVMLTVSQFGSAVEFYGKLLPYFGLKQVFSGEDFAYWVGGRTAVGLRPCGDKHQSETFVQERVGLHHLCFRARKHEDIDEAAKFLGSIGASIVRGPQYASWAPGYYYVLFEDQDKIRLEICHVPGGGVLEDGVSFEPGSDFKPGTAS